MSFNVATIEFTVVQSLNSLACIPHSASHYLFHEFQISG
jgi:hypothetical protein